jgi:hypothetical protein
MSKKLVEIGTLLLQSQYLQIRNMLTFDKNKKLHKNIF